VQVAIMSEERCHMTFLGEDSGIILKWILNKQSERTWTGFIWLKTGTSGVLL
jgi:hypothetical protein